MDVRRIPSWKGEARVWLAVLLAALAPAFTHAEVLNYQATAELRAIPGVSLRYYEVSGDSAVAVRASINQHRPTDAEGESYDALTNARITWNWSYAMQNGACTVTSATVKLRATVILPWLKSGEGLSSTDRRRWNAYILALAEHEKGHLQYAQDRLELMQAAMVEAGCEGADAAAEAIMQQIGRHDLVYDRTTDHGRTQGVTFH